MASFTDFCRPALIYIALGILSCLTAIMYKLPFIMVAINLVFVFFWAWVLNILCEKGYAGFAWFVVALPCLFMLVTLGKETVPNMK
jgi:hypothetical protein